MSGHKTAVAVIGKGFLHIAGFKDCSMPAGRSRPDQDLNLTVALSSHLCYLRCCWYWMHPCHSPMSRPLPVTKMQASRRRTERKRCGTYSF